jgi:hypothetical protein
MRHNMLHYCETITMLVKLHKYIWVATAADDICEEDALEGIAQQFHAMLTLIKSLRIHRFIEVACLSRIPLSPKC